MLIRVSPEALKNASQRIGVIGTETDEWYDRIKLLAHQMKDVWFGPGGEMAFDSIIQLLHHVTEGRDSLKECSETLDSVAQAFDAIDNGNPAIAIKVIPFVMPALLKVGTVNYVQNTGVINIEPEQVRQIANELNKVADDIRNAYGELKKTRNDLKSEWEGRAANKFFDKFIETSRVFPKISDAINDITNNIIVAANRYEEIDNMLG